MLEALGSILDFFGKGWVGITIGTATAYYFYRESLRLPIPKVTFKADHALTWSDREDLPPGVEISFDGVKVPRIARSMVRIWNAGSGCLNKELIPLHDPLKLTLDNGGLFVRAAVLKETNPASRCNVQINKTDPSEVLISFEYLDSNDGMVIAVLHTDTKAAPTLKGSIKGHKFKVVEEVPIKKLTGLRRWLHPFLLGVFPIILGIVLVIYGFATKEQLEQLKGLMSSDQPTNGVYGVPIYIRISYFVVGFAYLFIGARTFWKRRRLYPKSLSWQRKVINEEDEKRGTT